MTNELTPQQKFEEKIKDRLRDQIGDLMPDEALQGLVEKALTEHLFKPRISGDNYSRTERPSVFVAEVERQTQDRVREFINQYMDENSEQLKQAFSETIKTAMPALVAELMFRNLDARVYHVTQDMRAFLQNLIMNNPTLSGNGHINSGP